jgi:hypothetical protein
MNTVGSQMFPADLTPKNINSFEQLPISENFVLITKPTKYHGNSLHE